MRCNIGFIQNDTNNIILDAVLTDTGRAFLAKNDGSFSIVKFALGDDEVDYSAITKYGRTVGKEKIEKNTPVFEGLTNPAHAQKYRLVSVSNPNLVRLPALELTAAGASTSIVTLGKTTSTSTSITVEQTVQNEASIDVELRDQTFVVELNDLFLQIRGATPTSVDNMRRATYILPRAPQTTAINGSMLTFTLAVKSLTDAQFTVYGATNNKNIITTYVRVRGNQSGAVSEWTVNINKSL